MKKEGSEEIRLEFSGLSSALLDWYDEVKRDLPWRSTSDPYPIWVSEIILQQTRVEQGKGYYLRFIERFPNVRSLASANVQEVLAVWQGLGYYNRALNMHKAAQMIVHTKNGRFPTRAEEWRKLCGVGDYTAAAIASISFGEPQAAVDGNVLRVISRLTCESGFISDQTVRKRLSQRAQALISTARPGDYNQAMMELGALVCLPRNPRCTDCPVAPKCRAHALNQVHLFPVVAPKKLPKTVNLWYLVLYNRNGLYLHQRGNGSIWRQMWEFLPVEEDEYRSFFRDQKNKKSLSINTKAFELQGEFDFERERQIEHRLTHRVLRISFLPFDCGIAFTDDTLTFVSLKDIKKYPIPIVFSKFLNAIDLWAGSTK